MNPTLIYPFVNDLLLKPSTLKNNKTRITFSFKLRISFFFNTVGTLFEGEAIEP